MISGTKIKIMIFYFKFDIYFNLNTKLQNPSQFKSVFFVCVCVCVKQNAIKSTSFVIKFSNVHNLIHILN